MIYDPVTIADLVWTNPTRTVDAGVPAASDGTFIDDVGYAVWTYATRTVETTSQNITGAGSIPSAESVGQPTVTYVPIQNIVDAGSIPSAESVGLATISATIYPASIATAESVGAPAIATTISAISIASAESFGAPSLSATITTTSIASAESFGQPTITTITGINGAGGIASAESFGEPGISVSLYPESIASSESVGVPSISVIIQTSGIPSAESIGLPVVLNYTPILPETAYIEYTMSESRALTLAAELRTAINAEAATSRIVYATKGNQEIIIDAESRTVAAGA
jgi:hypothetical protein